MLQFRRSKKSSKLQQKQRNPILMLMMTLTKVIFDSIIHIIIQYRLYQKKNQFLAFKAIVEYAFTNIKNEDLPKPVLGILRTIRPFIKAQKKRQIAGMAGKSFGKLGAPYGKKGGRPRKKEAKTE